MEDEINAALPKLSPYPGLKEVKKDDLHKFLVRDDRTPDVLNKYYIAPGATWDSRALFGRSTFGYIAYDLETSDLVYLKVFWRPDLPGIQKEGDVYRELHEAQVSNVAKLGPAGDVPLLPDNHLGLVQRTRTRSS